MHTPGQMEPLVTQQRMNTCAVLFSQVPASVLCERLLSLEPVPQWHMPLAQGRAAGLEGELRGGRRALNFICHGGGHLERTEGRVRTSVALLAASCQSPSTSSPLLEGDLQRKAEGRADGLLEWKMVDATQPGASGVGLPKAVELKEAPPSSHRLRVIVTAAWTTGKASAQQAWGEPGQHFCAWSAPLEGCTPRSRALG